MGKFKNFLCCEFICLFIYLFSKDMSLKLGVSSMWRIGAMVTEIVLDLILWIYDENMDLILSREWKWISVIWNGLVDGTGWNVGGSSPAPLIQNSKPQNLSKISKSPLNPQNFNSSTPNPSWSLASTVTNLSCEKNQTYLEMWTRITNGNLMKEHKRKPCCQNLQSMRHSRAGWKEATC